MSGWIGVDLDGTLAEYHGWDGGRIGKPIPAMVDRVKQWLAEGQEVRIFTARIATDLYISKSQVCAAIHEWCQKVFGRCFQITCEKDMAMIELWDDRAVQVEPNTGRRVDDKIAELKAACKQAMRYLKDYGGDGEPLAYEACEKAIGEKV